MKTKTLAALALSVGLLMAGNAQATPELVAAWDMGQWCSVGFTCDPGFALLETMDAAYSDRDPNGLGSESAGYGTMHFDGQFGSTDVNPTFAAPGPWLPQPPSLALNSFVHMAPGFAGVIELGNPGNCASFALEGITSCGDYAMVASDAVEVVFKADLSPEPGVKGSAWEMSFAAAATTGTVDVNVSFSEDGINYSPVVVDEEVTTAGEIVSASLGGTNLTMAFVKLTLLGNTVIDNLAIKAELVPEPGTALLGLAGLAGLAVFGRRRA